MDPAELNSRMMHTWVTYIHNQKLTPFVNCIDVWDKEIAKKSNTVGPLLSWNNLSKHAVCWWDFCKALTKITFFMKRRDIVIGEDQRQFWNYNDKLGRIETFHKQDSQSYIGHTDTGAKTLASWIPLPYLSGLHVIRYYVYEVSVGQGSFTLDHEDRKRWKTSDSLRLTPSQIKWEVENVGFDTVEALTEINTLVLPKKVKFWLKDLLHINLVVRYKVDICRNCGLIIGSSHFLKDCVFIKGVVGWIQSNLVLKESNSARWFVRYAVWILHTTNF